MGYTCLARWTSSTAVGFNHVCEIISRNHLGVRKARWQLVIRSYKSIVPRQGGGDSQLYTISSPDTTYALIDDSAAPLRFDATSETVQPTHFRETFVTVSGSIDDLLLNTKAPWARTGMHVQIDGLVFAIGTDWVVRVGNILLPGGQNRGLLLETEYLPFPRVPGSAHSQDIINMSSGLVTSLIPSYGRDSAKVMRFYAEEEWNQVTGPQDTESEQPISTDETSEDDLYAYGVTASHQSPENQTTDLERDRRSVFLIHGVLRSEGILV
ncbi:hypothetical protein BKA62DRAFT_398760 [Auriculariales sp. MPI-PUGE-AT-0066]|nr:hypothetical protein BKA62DRAFT_398760 [Auriculariales sp. MPI-PUGE-AT-0066]